MFLIQQKARQQKAYRLFSEQPSTERHDIGRPSYFLPEMPHGQKKKKLYIFLHLAGESKLCSGEKELWAETLQVESVEMSITRERFLRSSDFYLLKSSFRSALYPQRCLLQEIFIRLSGRQSRIKHIFHKHNRLKGKGSHRAHIPLSKGKVRQLQKQCLLQLICVMTFVRSFKIFLFKTGVNFTSIPNHTVNSLVVNF